MTSVPYNQNNAAKDGEYQKKMMEELAKIAQMINDSVNQSLGIKSIGEDLNNAMSMMNGNTTSSLQDSIFNSDDGQQAMNKQNASANKSNQSMQMVSKVVEVVEENPELLALV
ncbi:hypothetical protein [Legionella sp. W05-934-2]|uniref:hypothetical protein n=1 Tax=Legionella sp. W05-934-2 TaxID=1198649 RepID=UPI003462ABF7